MSETTMKSETGKMSAANETWEVIKTVVLALLIALVLRVFLVQPYTIPSASMEPNLHEGDYIVVTKFSYGYSRHSVPFSPPIFSGRIPATGAPQRGDIAVFKTPRDNRTDLIKRVIGMPGDRIQVKGGALYLNDVAVPRQRVGTELGDTPDGEKMVTVYRETLPGGRSYLTYDAGHYDLDDTEVFTVPEGDYFMMGDNRDNSADSRVPTFEGGVGYLPAENLVGRARIILMAWNPGSALFKPWTWLNLNVHRFLKVLH